MSKRALVVDDSAATRFILSKMLKELGFEVSEAADGQLGLSKVQTEDKFELALIDWNMPNMNGLQMIEAVRQDGSNSDLKVIMVTTETEMSQVVKAIEAGANEYIMKPFTKEMIHEKLRLIGLACSNEN